MDLTSFHRVDPVFIADSRFHTDAGITLSNWELEFLKAFTDCLVEWSEHTANEMHTLGCSKQDVIVAPDVRITVMSTRFMAKIIFCG